MSYILIKSKTGRDTEAVLKYAKQRKIKAKVLSAEETEDKWIAKMIQEVEYEKEEYPIEELLQELRS